MALSFNDLLDSAKGDFFEDVPPMIATTSGGDAVLAYEDSWEFDKKYAYYEDYNDESFSTIDAYKNIHLDSSQVNLTQEENSQFIPFEMPRYYDGFDLSTTTLLIHFVNRDGYEDFDSPVNVSYSYEKIRFGWLVDSRVTAVDGIVRFEIQAIGSNSAGEEYMWRTSPSDDLNILKSLEGDGVIEPSSHWITGFMSSITEQVSLAKQYADEAKAAAESSGSNGSAPIILDKTLSIEGQAADAKAVGDKFIALPVSIADDSYTDVTGLRKPITISYVKSGNIITATTSLQGNKTSVSVVALGDDGRPSTITTDGVECVIGWEGFDA